MLLRAMKQLGPLLVSGTLLCSACAPTPTTPSPTAPPTVPSPSPAAQTAPSVSPVSSPSPGAQTNPAVDAALRDASTHLAVPVTDLTVVSVEARDWSDASLG